jgi:hypothetical protein
LSGTAPARPPPISSASSTISASLPLASNVPPYIFGGAPESTTADQTSA